MNGGPGPFHPPEALDRLCRNGSVPRPLGPPIGGGTLLATTLAWLVEHLGLFDPDGEGRALTEAGQFSAVLELAVVTRALCHRQLPAEAGELVARCADLVAHVLTRPWFRDGPLRSPTRFRYLAWMLGAVRGCGRETPREAEAAVRRLVDLAHGGLYNPAHPASGRLELRYVLDLGGYPHRLPGLAELYRAGVLGAPVDPVHVTELEVYDVTHAVFYTTDMGLRPPEALTAEEIATAARVVDDLLPHVVAAHNWDLTAELLMCARALGGGHGPVHHFARGCLDRAVLPGGAVTGPHFDPERCAALAPEHRVRYVFNRCYHTTLVAALAAGTWSCEVRS
ncbi:hypothetical protein JOF53_002862 [Crossiella equi]|uniref:DUF6895 domain-containing protein n=1 Tax=Crossiella equi TaxID=130796 RepID=A0ABS5ABM2_9PSEU|nr:hypothetical protein [Crossiella equi]MBP2473990.1 hypothetical protein [Crossiella equi]